MHRSNDCAAVVRYESRNISLSALGVRSRDHAEEEREERQKNARRTIDRILPCRKERISPPVLRCTPLSR
jgi:hypothetical protein